MELTSGAQLTERRGRCGRLGRREPKGKTVSAYGGSAASELAGLRGRMGRKVGQAETKKRNF
jgi:hypothetical protein